MIRKTGKSYVIVFLKFEENAEDELHNKNHIFLIFNLKLTGRQEC